MTLFFYGSNAYALRQQLTTMVEAYRRKAGSDFGLERIDGTSVSVRELSANLAAVPFLATSRLVIVEGAAGNKSAADKLAGVLAGVPESTVAVFVERQPDQRTVGFKALLKADKVVKFEPVTGPRLSVWVKAEAARLGGEIDAAAVRELIDTAGEDQWRLAEEINKLVNFAPKVTAQSVRELVAASVERSIFDLVEAMTAGRTGPALGLYRDLLSQRESEMYVLTMIQWQLRNLLLASSAPDGMSPAELAKEAGLSPYVVGKAMTAAGRMDEARLASAYVAAADCEYDIKTGRMRAEAAVEQLIYRVASEVAE